MIYSGGREGAFKEIVSPFCKVLSIEIGDFFYSMFLKPGKHVLFDQCSTVGEIDRAELATLGFPASNILTIGRPEIMQE